MLGSYWSLAPQGAVARSGHLSPAIGQGQGCLTWPHSSLMKSSASPVPAPSQWGPYSLWVPPAHLLTFLSGGSSGVHWGRGSWSLQAGSHLPGSAGMKVSVGPQGRLLPWSWSGCILRLWWRDPVRLCANPPPPWRHLELGIRWRRHPNLAVQAELEGGETWASGGWGEAGKWGVGGSPVNCG